MRPAEIEKRDAVFIKKIGVAGLDV